MSDKLREALEQIVRYCDGSTDPAIKATALAALAQQNDAEAWRPVVGFEDHYEVSNKGQIRSKKTNRILTSSALAGSGYVKADLWKDNSRTQTYVHRVVASAFLGEAPEDRQEVNHIDGNKINNRAENLEWASRSENVRHAMDKLGALVKPVVAIDPETLSEEHYPSIEEAGRRGYCATSIYKCLKGHRQLHAGKKWQFAAPPSSRMREALEDARAAGRLALRGGE